MKNRIYFVFFSLILLIGFVSFTSAQLAGVENQIEGAVDNLEKNITKIKEFTETSKWSFIGSQWKEFLLKNKAIAGVDAFLTKVNIVFVILFGMDWSLSMQMFFAFLLWIFTLFSTMEYFTSKNLLNWIYSLFIVVFVAFIGFFKYFGEFAVKLVFYKDLLFSKLIMFVLIVFLIVFFYIFNKSIAKKIKQNLIKKRDERNRLKQTKADAVIGEITKSTE